MLPRKMLLKNTLFRSPYKMTRRNIDGPGLGTGLTALLCIAAGAGVLGGLTIFLGGGLLWKVGNDFKIVRKDKEDDSHHNQSRPGK